MKIPAIKITTPVLVAYAAAVAGCVESNKRSNQGAAAER
jgi:hypothetical protein